MQSGVLLIHRSCSLAKWRFPNKSALLPCRAALLSDKAVWMLFFPHGHLVLTSKGIVWVWSKTTSTHVTPNFL